MKCLSRSLALAAALLAVVAPARIHDAHAVASAEQRPPVTLEKGKFLIASRDLSDPNFMETVLLLIAYGPGGAMGVVINRPSEVMLSRVLPSIKPLQRRSDTLFIGGPVARSNVLLLIRSAKEVEDAVLLFGDVYVSSSLTALRREIERQPARERLHAYSGHAGWAPGQLEAEVARGDWYVAPADPEAVFSKAPTEVWQKLIPRVEGDWVRRPNIQPFRVLLAQTHHWPGRGLIRCCSAVKPRRRRFQSPAQ